MEIKCVYANIDEQEMLQDLLMGKAHTNKLEIDFFIKKIAQRDFLVADSGIQKLHKIYEYYTSLPYLNNDEHNNNDQQELSHKRNGRVIEHKSFLK